MAKQIVPEGVIITTKDKQGKETVYKSDLKIRPFEKYVILVDNNTASAAEIVASAMQDSGVAKIVGEKHLVRVLCKVLLPMKVLVFLK